MSKTKKRLAIVGAGPRGLAALEALCLAWSSQYHENTLKIQIFEPADFPGAGQVWSPAQVDTNLSNIHERHISSGLLQRPEIKLGDCLIPAFESYNSWADFDSQDLSSPDFFPPRSKLGAYLHARFTSISEVLEAHSLLEIHKVGIIDLEILNGKCRITDSNNNEYTADEVLLTIGHQPTYESEQLESWEKHAAKSNLLLYTDPYPVGALETERIKPEMAVAMRGFGLSMVDQVRALTLGFGGTFEALSGTNKLVYKPSSRAPHQLVAFSLDGLPPAPKPFTPKIDFWFKPTENEMLQFKNQMQQVKESPQKYKDASFLLEAITNLTVPVFIRLGEKARKHNLSEEELQELTLKLIKEPNECKHALILDYDKPVVEVMYELLDMACGDEVVSLDYCLGQVWRHALGVFFHDFNHLDLDDEVMIEVVKYVEASKRYSYGPPVESLQQLLALVEAKILDLNFVNDPVIELIPSGWELQKSSNAIAVEVMVNSVIDPPQILKVSSPLIQNLIHDNKVNAVHYKLGLHTLEDGRIISKAGNTHQPVALLGRLAKGSVIGVDDLIECFGKPAGKWARAVIKRLVA